MSGLVIQTNATDIGKLTLKIMAAAAANTIWKGTGMNAKNSPMANAPLAERLFKCQRLASCKRRPNTLSDL